MAVNITRTRFPSICIALVCAALVIVRPGAAQNASPIGSWHTSTSQGTMTLVLNADGKGTLNGTPVAWSYNGSILRLIAAASTSDYNAAFTQTQLTLWGAGAERVVFERQTTGAPLPLAVPARSNIFPVPGNPPLTEEMVARATRFFEWILDARMTEEQQLRFRDSIVRSWTTRDKGDMGATLDMLKFHEDLGRMSEAQRNSVHAQISTQYIELMRKTPKDPLAQWVLGIYYSAHTPIAQGNPPLTRQVADAYAEVMCFMIGEVLGGDKFTPAKDFKDKLSASLAAEYTKLDAERQTAYSRLPMAWAAIRLSWPEMPEAERAKYRQEWTPGVRAMLAPAGVEPAAGGSKTSAADAVKKIEEHMAVSRMLFNMNQDYIHRYVLQPGWTYTKYAW